MHWPPCDVCDRPVREHVLRTIVDHPYRVRLPSGEGILAAQPEHRTPPGEVWIDRGTGADVSR